MVLGFLVAILLGGPAGIDDEERETFRPVPRPGSLSGICTMPGGAAAGCPLPMPRLEFAAPEEILLRFRPGVTPSFRAAVLARRALRPLRTSRSGSCVAARIPPGRALAEVLGALAVEESIAFAEPRPAPAWGLSGGGGAGPSDPLLADQWGYENDGARPCSRAGMDIDLEAAWAVTMGQPGVVVAVIDSGIDLDHPDLAGQIFPQGDEDWNFSVPGAKVPADSTGHGTAVAGLVAAAANGAGIVGVAPGCRLMPLKIDGLDMVMNFVDAIDYLLEFADRHRELRFVVNGSIRLTDTLAVRDAVRRAHDAGIVLCFSGGNGGGEIDCPASLPEAIAVGAMAPDGRRKREGGCGGGAWSSSHGPELDVVAPGVLLVTTDKTGPGGRVSGDYDPEFSGTSGASPIVAGTVALMLSIQPELTPDQVLDILRVSAVDGQGDPAEDRPGFDEYMGWGRLDAGKAVAMAAAGWRLEPGNADCDDDIDIQDILMVLECLFSGRPASPCLQASDVNRDGRVNISDAAYLANWLFRGGPPPKSKQVKVITRA